MALDDDVVTPLTQRLKNHDDPDLEDGSTTIRSHKSL